MSSTIICLSDSDFNAFFNPRVFQGGHQHSSHLHHHSQPGGPAAATVAAVVVKTPPAPEFEMKGNDFPALPGVPVSTTENRKISESGEGATPWESQKYVFTS